MTLYSKEERQRGSQECVRNTILYLKNMMVVFSTPHPHDYSIDGRICAYREVIEFLQSKCNHQYPNWVVGHYKDNICLWCGLEEK
jgi:hypothetical protein